MGYPEFEKAVICGRGTWVAGRAIVNGLVWQTALICGFGLVHRNR